LLEAHHIRRGFGRSYTTLLSAYTNTGIAHIVRNHSTSTAKAVATLRARSRWAISGTPVQNSLTDFLGLFKFLHFVPYNDPQVFDSHISQLWREKPVDEAAQTLKELLSCVMIRRTKAILDLPVRMDKILQLPFDREEEEYYRRIEKPVVELLDQSPGNSWPDAIQQINKLRLICNLGTFVPQRSGQDRSTVLDGSLQAPLTARLSMGEDTCTQCRGSVNLPSIDEGLGDQTSSNTYYSVCSLIYCAACTQLLQFRSPSPCGCTNSTTSCSLLPLSSSIRTPRLKPALDISPSIDPINDHRKISSKVRALIDQIKAYPNEKK
jgi:hypothetical protein